MLESNFDQTNGNIFINTNISAIKFDYSFIVFPLKSAVDLKFEK